MTQKNRMNNADDKLFMQQKNLDHLGLVEAQFYALGLVELMQNISHKPDSASLLVQVIPEYIPIAFEI